MTNLPLNKFQIQVVLDYLVKQFSGLNAMLEMTFNTFMKSNTLGIFKLTINAG